MKVKEHAVKNLKYLELPGFSKRQLEEHHNVLYAGYVKKLNEIQAKVPNVDLSQANATYSELGELKREETFAANGVLLHEEYFDNLGGNGKEQGDILNEINEEFQSYEKFLELFKASSIAARGWVVLSLNLWDGRLHIYSQDIHNNGVVWSCIPLLVLDVYEHAYFIDYGVKRKDYIESFFKNLDWNEVNKRYLVAKKMHEIYHEMES